jgi:hypothetical protein
MTGLWTIVVPSAGVNYALNPAFHKDTSNWDNYATGAGAGSRARTGDAAFQGFYGYKITKTGTTDKFGVLAYSTPTGAFVSGDYVVCSVFARVPSGTRLEMSMTINDGVDVLNTVVNTDGPFTGRIEGEIGPLSGTSVAANVTFSIPDGYGGSFDVDGMQWEAQTASFSATTYFDGSTEGCYWDGEFYTVPSVRPAAVRNGGTIENFDDYGFYITGLSDTGMAGVNHNIDPYAVQDGALYRNSRTPRRVFNLSGTLIGTSLEDLHDKRRALIDLFKNDVTGQNDPFWLRYSGGDGTLQIQCRYDSGLGGSRRPQDGFSERLSLRFVATDPYWQKEYNVGADIATILSFTTENNMATRAQGQWSGPDSIDNGVVFALAFHEGAIYVGGSFTTIDSDATMSYIAKWDGSAFSNLGSGANGNVKTLLVTPDGDLYAGGAFTSMGGVANTNRVARWDGSAWNALGTGGNGDVEALAYGSAEDVVYIGGAFTTIDGSARPRIARWEIQGDSLGDAMSSGADNNIVYAIAVAPDGDVYIAGTFTAASSVSNTLKIARFDGTNFNALSTGITGSVFALEANRNGQIFVGGSFTVAGGVTVSNVTEWNGTTFLDMNDGVNSTVYALHSLDDATLAIGKISSDTGFLGPPSENALVYWSGSTYYLPDFYVSTSDIIYAITSGGKYDLVVGGFWASSFYASATTITNNGTKTAYPRINITVAATITNVIGVHWIETYGTDGVLTFNPLSLVKSEEFVIDTRPGSVALTSNATQNRIGEMNQASLVTNIKLIPGESTFLIFGVETDPAEYEISVIWNELFWSADGQS